MGPERFLSLWLYGFGLCTLAHAWLEYARFDHPTIGTGLAFVGILWVLIGSYRLTVDGAETWPETHGVWTYAAVGSLLAYGALVAYLFLG